MTGNFLREKYKEKFAIEINQQSSGLSSQNTICEDGSFQKASESDEAKSRSQDAFLPEELNDFQVMGSDDT